MSIVKSFSVGHGDMFYIKHNSQNFTIIDCKMSEWNQDSIINELKAQSKGKEIVRFISTHPDEDHICGLAHLHGQMNLVNFYCVENEATKEEPTEDFDQYCALRDDKQRAFYLYKDCRRKWMNLASDETDAAGLSQSGIDILWPTTSNNEYKKALFEAKEGRCPNNISTIVKYSITNGAKILWMGDLETGFMENIEDEIQIGAIDIVFAPHHGRYSGRIPGEWLNDMKPKLIVIGEAPSEHLNYYQGYDTITQNSSGDITFDCLEGKTRVYVSERDYYVDFLEHGQVPDAYGGRYVGTLATR